MRQGEPDGGGLASHPAVFVTFKTACGCVLSHPIAEENLSNSGDTVEKIALREKKQKISAQGLSCIIYKKK